MENRFENFSEELWEEFYYTADFEIVDNLINYEAYKDGTIDWDEVLEVAAWHFNPNVLICNTFKTKSKDWWELQGIDSENLQEDLRKLYTLFLRRLHTICHLEAQFDLMIEEEESKED